MTESEARAVIVDALQRTASALNNPAVSDRLKSGTADVRIDELELDSLDVTEWCIELEAQTGIEFDPAEVVTAGTVTQLSKLLATKVADVAQPTA